MPNSDIKARNYVRNAAGVWTPVGYGFTDSPMPVALGNPNSAFAGMFATIGTFGALNVSMDAVMSLLDSFEGTVVDTANRWTTAGTVPPAQTQGLLSFSPGTTASATSTIASQFAFPTGSPITVGTSLALEATTIALGNHRFWGLGTPPSVPGTAAAPLQDAVGFEIDTAGVLRASVYSVGTRVFTQVLVIPTDGAYHRYAVIVRGDIAFWYRDAFDLPLANTFIGPSSQVLPVRFASLNTASVTGTPIMSTTGIALMDMARSGQATNDGTFAWRKAKVGILGDQLTSITNPGSPAGTAVGVSAFGALQASIDPTVMFFDSFEGTTFDTVNRWTTYGSVAATQTGGNLVVNPSTTASATVAVASQPTIGMTSPVQLAGLMTFESGTTALGNHRFWGYGTAPGNVGTAAAPLTDAVGFEVDTAGALRASVYNAGTRVFTQVIPMSTDGFPHFYQIMVRGDVSYFYKDNANAPVATSFAGPSSQLLPMRIHSLNSASVTGTPTFVQQGFAVLDLGRQATGLADGAFPWRRAKIDTYGSQNVALVGLAGVAAAIRPDSYLKVAQDASPLLTETFDAATLDVTSRWVTGGTAPTSALGALTFSAGTVALTVSSLTSQASFPLLGNMFNQTLSILKMDTSLKTGAYRFSGLGNATGSPTIAAPIQDGVGFEWIDTTGVLSGVVWSGGARLQSVSLAAFQPTDGAYHRYAVYFKTSRAYFEIDNVSVASIAFPNPNVSNLPLLSLVVNGASTVSPAAVMVSSYLGVADSSRNNHFLSDASFPWRKAQIGKAGGLSVKGSMSPLTSGNIAAAGTGTVGGWDVSEAGNVTFIAKNTVAANAWAGTPVLTFEQSDDNVSWGPLPVVRSDTNLFASTHTLGANAASTSIMFDCGVEGVNWVRCRVTTGPTTNGMTVVIQPGGMPFTPAVSIAQPTRTSVNLYGDALAVGATATEAALTLAQSKGTAATTSAVSFVIPAGKTFRISSIVIAQIGNVTGTVATTLIRLRVNTGGAVITTTTPIVWQARVATPATSLASQLLAFPLGEGYEIVGNGVTQYGFTVNSTYVTNAPTVDVTVTGYEY